ncbi:MAG TPA: glycosyltransferase family 39 protein [Thermoleophilaceae bacterium]|nr:glycosyltransferase family 39 protein [Thermoleophilaceae bacterium]
MDSSQTAQGSRVGDRWWPVGLFALALVLRVAWVLVVDRDGLAYNDTSFYHQTASQLADGDGYEWLGEPTSRWPPVYPGLLSLAYRAFGAEPLAGELLNAFLSAAAVPLLYLCARRMYGRREAIAAAALLTAFPGQIFLTDVLLAETLYTTLLVATLALCLALPRERWWTAAVVGVTVGVAAETRAEGLLLLILPLAIWWRPRRREVALLAAGAVLVVGAWTARNAVEMDAFVPISTNGSQTFWSGHNPSAHGGPTYAVGELGIAPRDDLSPRRKEIADARELRADAIDWMVSHPLDEALLTPRKLGWLLRGDSTALVQWVQPGARGEPPALSNNEAVPLGNLADLFFYGLLALTLLAAVVAWRSRPLSPAERALWMLIGASLVLYGFVLYGNYRYRMPLEPVMILLAVPLLVRSILRPQWTSAPSPSA